MIDPEVPGFQRPVTSSRYPLCPTQAGTCVAGRNRRAALPGSVRVDRCYRRRRIEYAWRRPAQDCPGSTVSGTRSRAVARCTSGRFRLDDLDRAPRARVRWRPGPWAYGLRTGRRSPGATGDARVGLPLSPNPSSPPACGGQRLPARSHALNHQPWVGAAHWLYSEELPNEEGGRAGRWCDDPTMVC